MSIRVDWEEYGYRGAGTPKELTDATDAAPVVPPQEQYADEVPEQVNVPLTDAQKYLMRSYQNKLNLLAKQKSEIDVQVARVEGAMQLDMMKIAREKNIDPAKFGFNENLDIIPLQPQGPPPGMRRA
jgi:hypothetical protein